MKDRDPIDRELRNLLSVDPPSGFESRVRAHAYRQPKTLSWNLRWMVAVASLAAASIAAVLVLQPHRSSKIPVAVIASQPAAPAPVVQPRPQPRLKAAPVRVRKATAAEPQLIIAANETSALRRLLSGQITELPAPFQPEVREFTTPETAIAPLPSPAAVTIDPIEPPTGGPIELWR